MTLTGSPLSDRFIRQLDDDEFRQEYMADQMRLRVALLVRTLREQRGWSQEELAVKMGTSQSAVSRMENPDYGKLAVQSLLEAAQAFRLPLYIDMPEWTEWLSRMSEHASDGLKRRSFDADRIIEDQAAAAAPARYITLSDKWVTAFVATDGAGRSLSMPTLVAGRGRDESATHTKLSFNTAGHC